MAKNAVEIGLAIADKAIALAAQVDEGAVAELEEQKAALVAMSGKAAPEPPTEPEPPVEPEPADSSETKKTKKAS